jgi:hypothetical protein
MIKKLWIAWVHDAFEGGDLVCNYPQLFVDLESLLQAKGLDLSLPVNN